jgi:REP element-mobilizing transposase RayT
VPRRDTVFAKGNYYHIYNRGAGRAPIFFGDGNYDYCLDLVARYQERYGATVIAYCLMPNHYHLLLKQETDEPLSKFVSVVFNAYAQAVNRQEGRTGALFEGRFRHVWVDREEYLVHLCRYIHLNPVEAKLVLHPEEWPYSNYQEWIGQRAEVLRDEGFIGERFPTTDAYRQFVEDYQDYQRVNEKIGPFLLDE